VLWISVILRIWELLLVILEESFPGSLNAIFFAKDIEKDLMGF